MCVCVCVCVLSHISSVWLFATLTVAHQAPLSKGFSRQQYWSGLPSLPPGDLPYPRIKPASLCLRQSQAGSLPLAPPGKPYICVCIYINLYIYVCTYVCMCICIYVCIYIYSEGIVDISWYFKVFNLWPICLSWCLLYSVLYWKRTQFTLEDLSKQLLQYRPFIQKYLLLAVLE